MDAKGDCILETPVPLSSHKYYLFFKRTIQFIVPVSVFSFLITTYFSGFPIFLSYYDLQFSTFALDRKYMFLVCNGILAFLAKNVKFSNHGSQQIDQLPQVLEVEAVQENVVAVSTNYEEKHIAWLQEHGSDSEKEAEQVQVQQTRDFVLENVVTEEEQDYDDDDNDELKDTTMLEETLPVDEISDVRVSTEELNKKFEEFIRKMKEEIRIEAQQPLITV